MTTTGMDEEEVLLLRSVAEAASMAWGRSVFEDTQALQCLLSACIAPQQFDTVRCQNFVRIHSQFDKESLYACFCC